MYNPFSLSGKTILVTGASSGIGKATALECAKLGASLIITARNEERLSATCSELDTSMGQSHKMILADLSSDEGLSALVSGIGPLDGVFSNAGITVNNAPVKFIKDEAVEQVFQMNTLSHIKLARDLFKKKKAA